MIRLLVAFTLLFPIKALLAQDRNIMPLKITKISVFKNGTFFTNESGAVSSRNKTFYFNPPAKVLNGTFWFSLKEATIETINIKSYPSQTTKSANTIGDYLQANLNTETILTVQFAQSTATIKGIIVAYHPETKAIKLKLADGSYKILSALHVVELTLNPDAKSVFTEDSPINLAKVSLSKDVSSSDFNVLSLQTGISWVPSYMLKINDAKKATLHVKATIANSFQTITDVPVSLVVGNPQLFYGKQLDLMSVDGYSNYEYDTRNKQYQNTSSGYDYAARSAAETSDESTEGEKSNDLYYYNLGNLTLEKDAKVLVKLSNSELEYKDLYELNIDDKVNYWQTKVASIDPNTVYETWHVLKIDNKTNAPLSTGPIFVIDEKGKPLAQDELIYTPVGAGTKIKLSKAVDVQTCDDEEVIAREESKTKINKRDYEKVKIKGKIKVINYQPKNIIINVSKTVNGKVTNNYGGTTTVLPNRNSNYYNLNDINIIKWDKEIKPNETLTLEYEYEVFVFIN